MKLTKIFIIITLSVVVASCSKKDDIIDNPDTVNQPYDATKDQIVKMKNELRATWISTVYNLDWPTTKGNVDAQKAELIAVLERCVSLNLNAVVLQVRPMADAFYPSSLEPWSSYLTGTQGIDPGYDPLKFAIDEAHKRGIELHAWLNPYRLGPPALALASTHVAVKNPDWVVTFGDMRYFNPGIPEVRTHLKNVIKDIVTRYAVDAIHFDDYFYPSGAKSTSNPFGFNDQDAFNKYGGGKDIHTWRAENVNIMVSEVSQVVHSTNPKVLFGISPSGRRENSLDLYADPLIWLENKWVDYLAPQVYWQFGHTTADFGICATYWNSNAKGVPIVIGIAAYKFKDPNYTAFGTVSEYGNQIDFVRNNANLHGCIFFRAKNLENTELSTYIKTKYNGKSVLPVMGLNPVSAPLAPSISLNGNKIVWNAVSGAEKYAVYVLERDNLLKNTFNAVGVDIISETQFTVTGGKTYFVTAVNSDHAESAKSNTVNS